MPLPILSFIVSLSHYSTGTFVKPSHTHNNNSPTTPLEVREVQCNDESLFPGHRDISPAKQEAYSAKFCQSFGYIPGQMNSNMTGVSEKYDVYDWIDVHIYYLFSIDWILGYALDADPSQDINWPVGVKGGSCFDIMRQNYIKFAHGELEVPFLIWPYY